MIALPDRIAETGEKRSEADALALLQANHIAATKVRHIRASYTALV
jgi:hypothetical protein